jgi:hypothetical protein
MLGSEIPIGIVPSALNQEIGPAATFVEALRRELVDELQEDSRAVRGKTLAAVAQQYEDTEGFGPASLRAIAARFYQSHTYTSSTVHEKLASLPFSLILTTCQDSLLTDALMRASKSPTKLRYHLRGDKRDNPEFELPDSPSSPLVYHLFGDAQVPSSLVLSENDVLDFLIRFVSERPPPPNSLLRALKRVGQSFLFIGFGIRHWDLRILLKILLRDLELDRSSTAIAAEPLRGLLQSDRDEVVLFYQRGTRVEVEDADLEGFLGEVSHRLEAEGGFAGGSEPIGPCPRVFISYAREDRELAFKLFDALKKARLEPWLDTESLVGGQDWDQRIQAELEGTDFALVLCTPAFCRKTDSYVNSEVAHARKRALKVRGSFLIPIRTDDLTDADRVEELREYNDMLLRRTAFDEDLRRLISTMLREYQRRNR